MGQVAHLFRGYAGFFVGKPIEYDLVKGTRVHAERDKEVYALY